MADNTDDRVNDGNNYRGLMKASEYKARREEVIANNVSAEVEAKRKQAAVEELIRKDREAKDQADKERLEREAERREKLKRELSGISGKAGSTDESLKSSKKKRKKEKEGSALSFDADEEI